MSFKIKAPYNIDWTPVYRTLDEEGVLGVANKNGTIRVDKNLNGDELHNTLIHEKVHVDDIKSGLLWYDDDYMYHRKNKKDPWIKIKRSKEMDGNPNLPHEKKANAIMKKNGK